MKKCRKNRFRKAMSVLLSAVLVIGMVSGAMPAEVCASEGEHTHNGITYTAWTRTDSLPTVAGNYYLTEDVTILSTWNVPRGTTNLCLNGKTIEQAGEAGNSYTTMNAFWIESSYRLNLYDCAGGGKLTGAKWAAVNNEGTFYMYGGEICGNISKLDPGGVDNRGTFYMYGGKIYDNTSERRPGGVDNWGTFHMYGGEISGNTGDLGGVLLGENNRIPAKMIVGGSVVISGNKDLDGVEYNVSLWKEIIDHDAQIVIDSKNPLCGTAKIGITVENGQPTEEVPIPFTAGNDQDYSDYFYSDNEKYVVIDGSDHAMLLSVKHEHTQDEETWSYDADSHWKECSKCGEKFREAAHTLGEWVTDTEATGTEDGQKHRDCSVCGFQETEIIPATRPTAPPTSSPTPAPTATPIPTPTSVATKKPDATPKPVATKKPTEAPKPVVTEKPSTTPKPVMTEQPSLTEKPPATKQPSVTPKPSVTEKPSASPMPPATEQPSATPQPMATKQPPATLKPEATKQPPATEKPIATEKPAATVRPGEIRLEVEVRGNAPDTRVSTSTEEIADRILTAEDRKELENGQNISMYVVVTDLSGSVSEADRVLAEAAAAGYMTGQYLDISLYKKVGGERTRVTGPLAGNISFTLTVPDGLKNTDSTKIREFAVVRVHNGEVAVLPDKDCDADTVTVDTDRFSTYEIVYKDTIVGSNTGTGNGNVSAGNNQNNTGSSNGGSQTGVPGSADGTVNTGGRTVGNANVNVEKKESKDSRDKKSGGSGTGHTKDGEPKTGDGAPLELVATIAMISGLSYVLLYFLERRRGMTEETKKEIMAKLIAWAKKGGRLRKGVAIAAIFVFLVYYHSVGKETDVEWKQVYDE